MVLVFAAALCSVVVSILLKYCHARGVSAFQMIAWNYVAATILCGLWFQPDLTQIMRTDTPWWVIILLGVLLPSIFLCLNRALKYAGVVKTEIAQRLSFLLSLLAAYFIFNEQFNALKYVGIVLGVLAIVLIVFGPKNHTQKTIGQKQVGQNGVLYLLMVWVGYAVVDTLLKYTSSMGLKFAATLQLSFIFALVLSILALVLLRTRWQLKAAVLGLVMGVINFANIALYVRAHQSLSDSPAVVFAGMNILVVVLGTLAGIGLFKEQLTPRISIALCLAVAAVACFTWSIA